MIAIIGAGLTGLTIANEIHRDSIIIEEQPRSGGLYALEEILDLEITSLPPLLFEKCNVLNSYEVEDIELKYKINKSKYIDKKICKECKKLPSYLQIKNRALYIKNLNILIKKYAKNAKIINGYPVKIGRDFILTNHSQLIKFDMLINTGSLKKVSDLLNIRLKLSSIPVYVAIIITTPQYQNTEWNVYIDGDFSISFSYVYKFDIIERKLQIYYAYSFLEDIRQPIDMKRIIADMKRRGIIKEEKDIVAYRSKMIRDGLLINENGEVNQNIERLKNCGRLGSWTNIDLCGVIEEAHKC